MVAAMNAPDLELARRFVAAHPPSGRLLLLGVTGSHQYGFSSPDSDLDLKGIHQVPTAQLLGLRPTLDSHDVTLDFEGVECDITTNELVRAVGLLLQGNGNILERIFTPWQVVETTALAELRALAAASLSRNVIHHYQGYFRGMQREHLKGSPPRAKSLLYTFRVALTGVHVLKTGRVEAHLPTLLERYPLDGVQPLIEHKVTTAEKAGIALDEAERLRQHWPMLEEMLTEALEASPLPEQPPNVADIEAWVVQQRMSDLG